MDNFLRAAVFLAFIIEGTPLASPNSSDKVVK